MRNMLRCCIIMLALATTVLVDQCTYASYINIDNQDSSNPNAVQDFGMRPRSACIERSGNCDHSPMNCCDSTVCRCNLWGANCRCARAGIF